MRRGSSSRSARADGGARTHPHAERVMALLHCVSIALLRQDLSRGRRACLPLAASPHHHRLRGRAAARKYRRLLHAGRVGGADTGGHAQSRHSARQSRRSARSSRWEEAPVEPAQIFLDMSCYRAARQRARSHPELHSKGRPRPGGASTEMPHASRRRRRAATRRGPPRDAPSELRTPHVCSCS